MTYPTCQYHCGNSAAQYSRQPRLRMCQSAAPEFFQGPAAPRIVSSALERARYAVPLVKSYCFLRLMSKRERWATCCRTGAVNDWSRLMRILLYRPRAGIDRSRSHWVTRIRASECRTRSLRSRFHSWSLRGNPSVFVDPVPSSESPSASFHPSRISAAAPQHRARSNPFNADCPLRFQIELPNALGGMVSFRRRTLHGLACWR